MEINYSKLHGLGNDFIVIDNRDCEIVGHHNEFARSICDRHFGVGADGLMLVNCSDKADFKMTLYNSDGGEAEMSGNGIRCFAKYVYEKMDPKKELFSVDTKAGIILPAIILKDKKVVAIEVDMGAPHFKRSEIPMKGKESSLVLDEELKVDDSSFKINLANMGNPHCVIFVTDLGKVDIGKWGPRIENHQLFPERINVHFVQVINDKEISMLTWERGVGETLACGTGASASVALANKSKRTGKRVLVHTPGGNLIIELNDENHVILTGPAEFISSGVYYYGQPS
ncbi:MAG: diaminopimelate epimerase [bacterium]